MCPECLSILEYDPGDRRWAGGRKDAPPPGSRLRVVDAPHAVLDCPECKYAIKL
jgi:hypothetical protein